MLRLTEGPEDTRPVWISESHILYLSKVDGITQIWELDLPRQFAKAMTTLPFSASNLIVHPVSRQMLFTMEVYVQDGSIHGSVDIGRKEKTKKNTGVVYGSFGFRSFRGLIQRSPVC